MVGSYLAYEFKDFVNRKLIKMGLSLNQYRFFFNSCLFFLLFFVSGCAPTKKSQKKIVMESELLNISDLITGRPLQIGIVSDYLLIKTQVMILGLH